jgi:hypothetical protein
MRQSILLALVSLTFLATTFAEKKPDAATPDESQVAASVAEGDAGGRLPVKRVVLYKNGVGYFEHSARVHGNQELAIDFTTSQLNDVLKSLTAVDLGDGRISGVRYNSIAPLDERLKALRLPFGEQLTRVPCKGRSRPPCKRPSAAFSIKRIKSTVWGRRSKPANAR